MSTDNISDKQRDLQVLEYTNTIRKQLVEDIIKDGIPSALDNREMLLKSLDGLDKNAVAKMKLRIDEANSQTAKAQQKLVSDYLKEKSRRRLHAIRTNSNQDIPEVDHELGDIVMGEMDVNPKPVELDDIMTDES